MVDQIFADSLLLSLLLPPSSPTFAGGIGVLSSQGRPSTTAFEKCLCSRNYIAKYLVAAAWPVWMVKANELTEPGPHLVLCRRWRNIEYRPRVLLLLGLVLGVGSSPAPWCTCSTALVQRRPNVMSGRHCRRRGAEPPTNGIDQARHDSEAGKRIWCVASCPSGATIFSRSSGSHGCLGGPRHGFCAGRHGLEQWKHASEIA
mmetsp:Transcript_108302/g.285584  ORF Transcript_108302/g.285584 Transcript_108302/m.285584 type:complete len:202 (-) Transcript_108302:4-609(-)